MVRQINQNEYDKIYDISTTRSLLHSLLFSAHKGLELEPVSNERRLILNSLK